MSLVLLLCQSEAVVYSERIRKQVLLLQGFLTISVLLSLFQNLDLRVW